MTELKSVRFTELESAKGGLCKAKLGCWNLKLTQGFRSRSQAAETLHWAAPATAANAGGDFFPSLPCS